MEIESTTFGTITIDGKTYEHDVIIRLSGDVVKRNKKLSKKYYGTSHVLSKDEAKFVFEKGCEQLILGSGQMGNVQDYDIRFGDSLIEKMHEAVSNSRDLVILFTHDYLQSPYGVRGQLTVVHLPWRLTFCAPPRNTARQAGLR
jgi:hypothetical protein